MSCMSGMTRCALVCPPPHRPAFLYVQVSASTNMGMTQLDGCMFSLGREQVNSGRGYLAKSANRLCRVNVQNQLGIKNTLVRMVLERDF